MKHDNEDEEEQEEQEEKEDQEEQDEYVITRMLPWRKNSISILIWWQILDHIKFTFKSIKYARNHVHIY